MLQSPSDPQPSRGEHLDVLIVGAGISGIDAAYRIREGDRDRRFAIFEARGAIGGTWDLFRYPGIRSDSDMTTLGFPFHPWRGEKSIVDGADIRDYVEETAREYGLDCAIRFHHRVTGADWSSAQARWTVSYEANGVAGSVTCGFLYVCSGYYDYERAHTPTWPGMESFTGRIVYPQFWPEDLAVDGKRVVVIGSGATAVTLVPSLVNAGAQVTMLQRSPTYIVSRPARDERAIAWRRRLPRWLADHAIRWKNIAYGIAVYRFARRKPDRLKAMIAAGQRGFLGPDFDMTHLTPRYEPWDQRLCLVPDGDMFRALKDGKATIVTDQIDRFQPAGLALQSGAELPADIVVSATGLTVKMLGGATLSVDGEQVATGTRMLYKGAMLEGVPNFAFAVGYTNASWTLKCDLTARFVNRLLTHMKRRGLDFVTPEAGADARGVEPMLDLKSGYVERAASLLPRQGIRAPWRVHQNYARDLLAFRLGRMRDGVLRFGKASAATRKEAA